MVVKFETSRLSVFEVSSEISQSALSRILPRVVELLSTVVVKHLPPYFQNINSVADANIWFERMVSESRLFVIEQKDPGLIVGFLFAHCGNNREAHIGYLLGESYWGQGLASELLTAFIELAKKEGQWVKLIGGVDKTNKSSSYLLAKLGFSEQPSTDGSVVFYEYPLSQPQ